MELYQYIYEDCKAAFLDEWRRKQSLENAVRLYFSFYSLFLGLGLFKIDKFYTLLLTFLGIQNFFMYFLTFIIYLTLIYCEFRGLWITVKAMKMGRYRTFPKPSQLIERMTNKNSIIYLKSLSQDFAKSQIYNEKVNDKRADLLNESYKFLECLIIFSTIFFLSIFFVLIKEGKLW